MGNIPQWILASEYSNIFVHTDKSYKHTKIKYIPTEFSNGFFTSHTRNAKLFNTLPSFVTRRRRQMKLSGTDGVCHIVYPFCCHFKHLTSRFWTGWYSSFHTNFYFLKISVNYKIKVSLCMIKLGLFVYTKLIYVQISCKMESFYLENFKKS